MSSSTYYFLLLTLFLGQCNSSKNMPPTSNDAANALINETSPYLLQHAYNPVDWNAWNEYALQKAKEEDKLMIISIGYSACHWCHVMEHESFEDSLVAEIMNEHFVPIKVDREERPDVDDVYMTACNLINGSGGWPLNAVALPDGRPIWAGTYFPKERWIKILRQFVQLKEEDYQKLVSSAEKLTSGLQQVDDVIDVSSEIDFSQEELMQIGSKFISNVDLKKGGRKGIQKFPLPNNYEFLLQFADKYPESQANEAILATLDAMISGGIYDHLEGGWSRYTVDSDWKIPHFEKMLYDNAQLVSLYSQAYKKYKRDSYRRVVNETFEFMQIRWKSEYGGYYSSFDADSDGEEGKFYTWTYDELKALIPADEFEKFIVYYNVEEEGNWEEVNILYTDSKSVDNSSAMDEMIEGWRQLLLAERNKRNLPGLDDKILCSWNAMLISGLADAYEAFGEERFRQEALNIWKFIESNLFSETDSRLDRNFKAGKSTINAFLDDYAQVIKALTQLYQITFDEQYLNKANDLMIYTIDHFTKEESVMFNYTSDLDPPLVARKLELTDGVVPSSNSVMAHNLKTLGLLLYNQDFLSRAQQMLRNMKTSVLETNQPNFYSNWCSLWFEMVFPTYEVAILGEQFEDYRTEMVANYHPNAVFLGGPKEGSLALLKDKLQEGDTYVYVCVNKACKLPVTDPKKALELMD